MLPVILCAAAALRLWALTLLPLHSDEGTYISWGLRALHAREAGDLLASVEDGKQPLLAWLLAPLLLVAEAQDRLFAARLASVGTGLLNVWLVYRIGSGLWDRRVGWLAAALYGIVPITLVHDRMALYDSLEATTYILVLAAALGWAGAPTWMRTWALGLAMGLALLTKLSALFFVALVPVLVLLWRREALRRWWRLAHSYLLAAAVYSVVYASPLVKNIEEGNFQRYALTTGEVLGFPHQLWTANVTFVAEAAWTYLTWPVLAAAAVGLAWGLLRGNRGDRALAAWTLWPLLAFVLTAKLFYSRYLVFSFAAALLPAARILVLGYNRLSYLAPSGSALQGRARQGAAALLAALGLVPSASFALLLLTDPVRVPWMDDRRFITDRFQYVESNYAGYGLTDVVRYLLRVASQREVVVLTRPATGMPRDGVAAYLGYVPGITVGHVDEDESIAQRLARRLDHVYQAAVRAGEVYYVLTDAKEGEQERRFRQLNPGVEPVLVSTKPGGRSRFLLYHAQLGPDPNTWLMPAPLLGNAIALEGYRFSIGSEFLVPGSETRAAADAPGKQEPGTEHVLVRPGETLRVSLFWRAVGRSPHDLTVFTHLVGPDGRIWAQHDKPPRTGQSPTSLWQPGDFVGEVYDLHVRADAPAGRYRLLTGMYRLETMERLPLTDGRGAPAGDSLLIAEVEVGS